MVGEFPDLQGYMGTCYARAGGEPDAVADAIEEAYLPRFAGDAIPGTAAGRALALAERLDTLAGIFGIGLGPTGDRDPYALRRSALGALRILVEGEIDADLQALVRQAVEGYGEPLDAGHEPLAREVFEFMMERLRGWSEAPADVFAAVHARRPTRPLDFVRRMDAVQAFRALPEAASLAAANKRIANILRQVAEIDAGSRQRHSEVNRALFREPAEDRLASQVLAVAPGVEAMLARGDYTEAMTALAGLRAGGRRVLRSRAGHDRRPGHPGEPARPPRPHRGSLPGDRRHLPPPGVTPRTCPGRPKRTVKLRRWSGGPPSAKRPALPGSSRGS